MIAARARQFHHLAAREEGPGLRHRHRQHSQPIASELVRKGRFDEIFFVDLAGYRRTPRHLKIHLLKRNRNPDDFDLHTLAMASDGLSGAEIEQAVIAWLYEAFDQNRPLDNVRPARRAASTPCRSAR